MTARLLTVGMILVLCSACAAPDTTAPAVFSNFRCVTITEADAHSPKLSCDALCAEKKAVCTGVTSPLSPPPSCANNPVSSLITCRCCGNIE